MNTNPPTPDYGEPWIVGRIDRPMEDRHGHDPLMLHRTASRAVACVNACAGMVDPAEEIASLKSERDEAIAKLSTVFQWINRNHPDGFVDSLTHLENLERISDDHHERVDGLERDCKAMREAIREAHSAIKASPYPDQQALAKLKPFITP